VGTVHYYFANFFGINAGLGLTGLFIKATADFYQQYTNIKYSSDITFYGVYFSIPVGFRFSFSVFTVGAGLMGNIPLGSGGQRAVYNGNKARTLEDKNFQMDPYMSWYLDLGFDLSGRRNRQGGFGMMLRLHTPLDEQIASSSTTGYKYSRFYYVGLSLVFQAGIELKNFGRR